MIEADCRTVDSESRAAGSNGCITNREACWIGGERLSAYGED